MRRSRAAFISIMGVMALAIALTIALGARPGEPLIEDEDDERLRVVPRGAVLITVASSSTKQNWMEEVVAQFAAEDIRTDDRHQIAVQVLPVLSGGSMNAILDGSLQPTVWSPGAESWVAQLEREWRARYGRAPWSATCQPTVLTPLGFAMWRPMAEALGWPDSPVGWETIVELASDPSGWERYGHPEWGEFQFGQAHPAYSNAGLLTSTSFVYGLTGKTDTLAPADVYQQRVKDDMTALAGNTSKYGMITTDLLRLMAQEGPRYLHAVATFESDTVSLNLQREEELRFPVAFVFPSEGTFWGNHPFCTFDRADWVTEEQAEASSLFLDFLLDQERQKLAARHLLRPLDDSIRLEPPLDLAHGTDPRVSTDSVAALPFPNAEVSKAIIDTFVETKRKATVLIAIDVSGSMAGRKIRSATDATAAFLRRLHPEDSVGLVTFSDDVLVLSQLDRAAEVGEELAARVATLTADNNTALHQAVCDSTRLVQEMRAADRARGEERLYGIVLLSDGEDTRGRPSANEMFTTCLPAHAELDGVKVFPIAFGEDADVRTLERTARVTGGTMFTATPENIDRVYLRISAEQ